MKKSDMLLMVHLRRNSRTSLTSIARNTKIPISTLYEKLKNKSGNLFKKFTTIIDFGAIGFNSRVTVVVKTMFEKREDMLNYLLRHPNVNNVYRINNGFDFQYEAIFRNLKEQEDFMEDFENLFPIKKKEVYCVVDDVKREGFLEDEPILA